MTTKHSVGAHRWILVLNIQTRCYLLNSFKRTKRVSQQAPSWFSWMWVKSQFLQMRTFWSRQISGFNFVLPFTIVFSLSHISKVESGLQQEHTMYSFWTNCRILVLGKNYIFCYKQFCSHSIRMTRFPVLWNYCITWKNISHVKGWMSALFQTYTTVSSRAALTQTTTCRP